MNKFSLLILLIFLAYTSCTNEKAHDLSTEIHRIENGLLPSVQAKGDRVKKFNLLERMKHYKVPGVSMAIVQDGKLKWAKGYGIANTDNGHEVNMHTLFQAGSISKPIAALAVLKLVEEGFLDLDQDVNVYLKDWKIPDSEFTIKEKVTLRRLLTHSAGITVHGFPGYRQTDAFPSITTVLNGKGNTAAIYVDTIPGSLWRYSGGGYTVMEKVVEDVSGLPFEEYMARNILQPMGMDNSTYGQPLDPPHHANASAAYDREGKIIEGFWHNYPEQAAAGLWTTPTDLAAYCMGIQHIFSGKEKGVFSKNTIEAMLTKHQNNWGLGPSLRGEEETLLFGHGGKNAGFTNDLIAFAHRGDAVIVMTNADNGGQLIGEILRSVSTNYNWGIAHQEMLETMELPARQLQTMAGRYRADFQGPETGDYSVDVSVKDNRLFVSDPNTRETYTLTALEAWKFIDLEKGDKVDFQITENKEIEGFLWNGQYPFSKVKE